MSLVAVSCMSWHPFPWGDPELERLRRLVEQRQIEMEKARLRRWLDQHGWPTRPGPCPMPRPPVLPLRPLPCAPARPSLPVGVGDVLDKIR